MRISDWSSDVCSSDLTLLWNDPKLAALPWLSRDNGDLVRHLFPQFYLGFRERYAARLDPAVLDLGAGIAERLAAYLPREPAARPIAHGDLPLSNVRSEGRREGTE